MSVVLSNGTLASSVALPPASTVKLWSLAVEPASGSVYTLGCSSRSGVVTHELGIVTAGGGYAALTTSVGDVANMLFTAGSAVVTAAGSSVTVGVAAAPGAESLRAISTGGGVAGADFGRVYATNATGFQQAFVAALSASTGGVATVRILSITAGSIIVSTLVGFPPTGSACTAGALSPCGTFLATLLAAPGALFASQPMLANLPATVLSVAVAFNGQTSLVQNTIPTPPAAVIAPPAGAPKTARTSLGAILGALVGAGIIGPGTVFGILVFYFKDSLRRWLLKRGFVRVADFFVPDLQSDVATLAVKLAEMEAFMTDVKKLPRLMDVTPELQAASIDVDVSEPLGKGGFGVVYRGVLKGQKPKPVAVKMLFGAAGLNNTAVVPANVTQQMRQEATIMCSLNHPNVLHVFGVVPERGWIVMELCAGGALSELLLDAEQELDELALVRLAAETAAGVAYLHTVEVKIVHGDLKAANVLLSADRKVRICDFGMAVAKDRSKSMTSVGMGSSNSTGITVAWTAPEVLKNEEKSFASDVFALGVTLWEIFERARPFGNMPDMAAVSELLNGGRPALTSGKTPPYAAKVIAACWAQNPGKRCTAAEAACVLIKVHRSVIF